MEDREFMTLYQTHSLHFTLNSSLANEKKRICVLYICFSLCHRKRFKKETIQQIAELSENSINGAKHQQRDVAKPLTEDDLPAGSSFNLIVYGSNL